MRRAGLILALVPVLWLLAGCGGGHERGGSGGGPTRETASEPLPARGDIGFSIPGVPSGARMPKRYTCDGDGGSPPLRWDGLPGGTRSLIILVTDPDAEGGPFFHWAVYDLPPGSRGLGAGQLPPGAKQGLNSRGDAAWAPPCPPEGDLPHRYYFQLWAESESSGLAPGAERSLVARATAGHRLGYGMFAVRYGR